MLDTASQPIVPPASAHARPTTGALRALGANPATAPVMLHPGDAIPARKRVLYIQHGAGEHGADLADTVRRVARELECDWIETRTRNSVARLYRRVGFDINYCVPILEVQ